jgi:hypothetical protein
MPVINQKPLLLEIGSAGKASCSAGWGKTRVVGGHNFDMLIHLELKEVSHFGN